MTISPTSSPLPTGVSQAPTQPKLTAEENTNVRFEQLLWAELLTHTGLEKALTLGGGDGAAMFSRYFVEAIAEDIAKQHPLGLLDQNEAVTTPSEPEAGSES
ncbi:MAG: hypothetical protein K0U61_09925 [Alphaproteobacteria bacterium]|jgi:hypothetical protein|nr:hypothetical protein [Henriciella sp.]MBO6694008.1 hypothetical protein [Henriciella sp.]MCH9752518.1 hypothetical protein [Alphaproteobacteria bacterium]